MGSDGNPPRSPARLPHTVGPMTAKIDGQFWRSQLTSPLPFLTIPSMVSQVWYIHPGFLLHESRPRLPDAPHGQREIHRGRLIRRTACFYYVLRCRTATHSSCRHPLCRKRSRWSTPPLHCLPPTTSIEQRQNSLCHCLLNTLIQGLRLQPISPAAN